MHGVAELVREGGDAGEGILPGHGDEGLGAESPGGEGAASLSQVRAAVGPALRQPAANFGDVLRTQWRQGRQNSLHASFPGKARLLGKWSFQVIAVQITLRQPQQAASNAEVAMPDREELP